MQPWVSSTLVLPIDDEVQGVLALFHYASYKRQWDGTLQDGYHESL